MRRLLYYSLLLLVVSFSACEKDETDACVECDEAIHHMGDKINTYGCNPSYMQNAWDAINAKCDRGSQKVGYMAETCILGSTSVPKCLEVLSTANIQDKVLFKISFTSSTPNDTIDVTFRRVRDDRYYGDDENLDLDANQTFIVPYPDVIQEGDQMVVLFGEWVNPNKEQKTFSFNRPDKWSLTRTVNITRDPQTNELNLEFVNW